MPRTWGASGAAAPHPKKGSEEHSRFTALFERLAIDVLQETDVQGAARILDLSWDEAWHLMERAVARGQRAKAPHVPARLSVDETAAKKGHHYVTIVSDLDGVSVEYVADERTQASLDGYFAGLGKEQRAGIEAIAMDMGPPYIQAARTYVPDADAKLVFDRYHIMAHMGRAVDTVRKREHRALREVGDETLSGSKYLWLHGREHLPERHRERFAALKTANLKTGRAWAIPSLGYEGEPA